MNQQLIFQLNILSRMLELKSSLSKEKIYYIVFSDYPSASAIKGILERSSDIVGKDHLAFFDKLMVNINKRG